MRIWIDANEFLKKAHDGLEDMDMNYCKEYCSVDRGHYIIRGCPTTTYTVNIFSKETNATGVAKATKYAGESYG